MNQTFKLMHGFAFIFLVLCFRCTSKDSTCIRFTKEWVNVWSATARVSWAPEERLPTVQATLAQGSQEHGILDSTVSQEYIYTHSIISFRIIACWWMTLFVSSGIYIFIHARMSEKERIEFRRRRADEIFTTLFKNHQLAKQRAAEQTKRVEVFAY